MTNFVVRWAIKGSAIAGLLYLNHKAAEYTMNLCANIFFFDDTRPSRPQVCYEAKAALVEAARGPALAEPSERPPQECAKAEETPGGPCAKSTEVDKKN